MSYLKVVYSRRREPKTTYPRELIKYLYGRFNLKKGDKLLELGFGNGDFLNEFSKIGLKCYGIDKEILSPIDKDIQIKKINIDRRKLPYPDRYFDVVYHKSFLEHFYTKEVEFIMKESYRVLKKGGKIIILVPEWTSQMENFFEDYSHVHPYDCIAVKDLLQIYNFKKVISEKFYQLPVVWKHYYIKPISKLLGVFINTPLARKFTDIFGWKFVRWSVELMVLGYGEK